MSNAYEKALNLLKIRLHHSEELARKLVSRGYKRADVAEAINKLTQAGLLDNAQFAQTYLDNLIKYKIFGFYGLKAKLMMRGIASNEAEALLLENLPVERETEIARRFVEKQNETDKVKLAQKLSRRGFRSQVIKRLLDFT
ncbi:MAG: regulatory protein RecX [Candidatus Doudnabacteria bacterium]|nr:regulatory protein RecX [Candidatus Doudnabacteria bacterium]